MRPLRKYGFWTLLLAGAASAAWFALHPSDLVHDAQVSLARGNLRAAQLDLDSYLKGHPHHPAASFQLGLVNLAQENGLSAERNLRVAQQGGVDPASIVIPLGRAYILQRHYDQALADFNLAAAPPGAAPQILTVRALALLGLHRTDEAKAAIQDALRAQPDDADAGLVAARIAMASGDLNQARQAVTHVLTVHPDRADAALLRADITLAQGDAEGALAVAQSLLATSPDLVDAKLSAARSLAALRRDADSIALLDAVHRVAPRRVDAHYLRAILAVRQNDYATADQQMAILSPVIDQLPLGNYLLAVTKLARGQPDQAEAAASTYAARHPGEAGAAKLLALSELAVGRPDRAQAALLPFLGSAAADAEMLTLRARAEAMQGDVAGAASSLTQAASIAPGDIDVLNRLAAARLRLGDTAAGTDALRQSLAATPDQPEQVRTLVQASLAAGDFPAARAAVAKLRAVAGESAMVGGLSGEIAAAGLDFAEARQDFNAVLDKFPDSHDATFGLIQLDQLAGDDAAARARLADWMASHPADPTGLPLAVGQALRAGKIDDAIALQEAAHKAAPADRHITATLARLYLDNHQAQQAITLLGRAASTGETAFLSLQAEAQARNGNPAEARRLYLQAADAQPKDPAPRLGLIELALQAKDFDAARQAASQALADNPGEPRLLAAAVGIEQRAAGLPAALAKAAALRANPANLPAAASLQGNLLAAAGDRLGAAAADRAAFAQSPSGPLAIQAAVAAARAGKPQAATALLTQWVATHPDYVPALQLLASLAMTGHDMNQAGKWLDQVLARSADNVVALNNSAWVKLAQGDLPAARGLAQRAYILAPGADTQDTLGWVLARGGDTARALPLLQQAAATRPEPTILYHEAYVLHAAGKADDARAALDRALGDKREFEDRAAAEGLRKSLEK